MSETPETPKKREMSTHEVMLRSDIDDAYREHTDATAIATIGGDLKKPTLTLLRGMVIDEQEGVNWGISITKGHLPEGVRIVLTLMVIDLDDGTEGICHFSLSDKRAVALEPGMPPIDEDDYYILSWCIKNAEWLPEPAQELATQPEQDSPEAWYE